MNKICFFIFSFLFVQVLSAQNGCTDDLAASYDPTATIDDGSCLYVGCPDSSFLEYYTQDIASSPNFSTLTLGINLFDDGSCVEPVVEGCTNPAYDEFNPMANLDDGSCITLSGSSSSCGLYVNYAITNNCDDTWVVEFDFGTPAPIPGLDIFVDFINLLLISE